MQNPGLVQKPEQLLVDVTLLRNSKTGHKTLLSFSRAPILGELQLRATCQQKPEQIQALVLNGALSCALLFNPQNTYKSTSPDKITYLRSFPGFISVTKAMLLCVLLSRFT